MSITALCASHHWRWTPKGKATNYSLLALFNIGKCDSLYFPIPQVTHIKQVRTLGLKVSHVQLMAIGQVEVPRPLLLPPSLAHTRVPRGHHRLRLRYRIHLAPNSSSPTLKFRTSPIHLPHPVRLSPHKKSRAKHHPQRPFRVSNHTETGKLFRPIC